MDEVTTMDSNGNTVTYHTSEGYFYTHPYVDWDGNPVRRTRDEYRYSYDPYVVHKVADEYQHAQYCDRLRQEDYNKFRDLCEKHFGERGDYWDNRPVKKIEAFLRDFNNKPELELVGIMQGCNVSNGYPYWIFMFNEDS